MNISNQTSRIMDELKVGLFAMANVAGSVVSNLQKYDEIVQFLIHVGQLAVAVVTVIYIIVKIKKKNHK